MGCAKSVVMICFAFLRCIGAVLFTFWILSRCFIKAREHKNTCPLVWPLGIRENRADVEIDRDSNSNILGIHPNGVDRSTTPAWVALKIQFALLLKKCTVLVVSIYSTSQVGTPRVCTVFVHVKGIVLRLNINFWKKRRKDFLQQLFLSNQSRGPQ